MTGPATRLAVLDILKARLGQFVSGEEVSLHLGISRTAIWKQIEALRAQGYSIEATPRLGYRLVALPDLVTPSEIQAGLDAGRLGHTIAFRPSVVSTNDECKELGRQGAPEGTVVIAEEQVGGRGRLGRAWYSPPGVGIWMSVLLRPLLPPYEVPRLTLVAAVAVAEACWGTAAAPVRIKWPNDVLLGGRKVCGILTELEADWDRVNFAVIGMGLNVNQEADDFPAEAAALATSLRMGLGRPLRRAPLAQAILQRLEAGYSELLGGRFDDILSRWRNFSDTLGQRVRVLPVAAGQPGLEGVAEDLDNDGALLVRLDDGRLERVLGGEVSIRPAE